jgi:hypothetical protein
MNTIQPSFGETDLPHSQYFDDWDGEHDPEFAGVKSLASPKITAFTIYGSEIIQGIKTSFEADGSTYSESHGTTSGTGKMFSIAADDYLVYLSFDFGPWVGHGSFVLSMNLLTKKGQHGRFGSNTGGTSWKQLAMDGKHIVALLGFTDTTPIAEKEGPYIAALGGVLAPLPG